MTRDESSMSSSASTCARNRNQEKPAINTITQPLHIHLNVKPGSSIIFKQTYHFPFGGGKRFCDSTPNEKFLQQCSRHRFPNRNKTPITTTNTLRANQTVGRQTRPYVRRRDKPMAAHRVDFSRDAQQPPFAAVGGLFDQGKQAGESKWKIGHGEGRGRYAHQNAARTQTEMRKSKL